MDPLVSIIIPVYNSEEYVAATIKSCINQAYTNIEIILVNDGSTDNSEEVIRQFTDSRIKYFKIANSGSCEARNFGISKATGVLYQFLDHDDLIHENKIQHQVEAYKVHGNEYIYSCKVGSVSGNVSTIDPGYELYNKDFTPQQYFETVLNQFGKYITTGAWLIPVEIIKTTYGWDGRSGINDDGEYLMRLILPSKGIIFCQDSIFYFRRDVEGSLSKQFDSKEVYVKWLYSYKSYVKFFLQYFSPEKARALGRNALSVYYCASHPYYPELLKECREEINKLGYKTPVAYGGSIFKAVAAVLGVDITLQLLAVKNSIFKKRRY